MSFLKNTVISICLRQHCFARKPGRLLFSIGAQNPNGFLFEGMATPDPTNAWRLCLQKFWRQHANTRTTNNSTSNNTHTVTQPATTVHTCSLVLSTWPLSLVQVVLAVVLGLHVAAASQTMTSMTCTSGPRRCMAALSCETCTSFNTSCSSQAMSPQHPSHSTPTRSPHAYFCPHS